MLRRFLATIALIAAASFAAPRPAAANPKGDITAVLRSFAAALDDLDPKRVAATCAAKTAIVDEFAPFECHSCAAWFRDLRKLVMTFHEVDFQITAGAPKPVEVDGTSAYAVVPMQITWREVGGWQWESRAALP
jgi:hypothetical protein